MVDVTDKLEEGHHDGDGWDGDTEWREGVQRTLEKVITVIDITMAWEEEWQRCFAMLGGEERREGVCGFRKDAKNRADR